MRIGVVSDSHGDRENLLKAIEKMEQVDAIFHLGDFVKDNRYIEENYSGKIYCVTGNCDILTGLASKERDVPEELLVEINGKKIYATHGHKYRVKQGLTSIYYRGREVNADIVLYGHTHCPHVIKEGKMVILNPGSVAVPRGGSAPTFGIIEAVEGKIIPRIIEL